MAIIMAQNFIDLSGILWYLNLLFWYITYFSTLDKIHIYCFDRYKEEIQQIQEREENLFGENHLKMNLNQILYTKEEVFFQWRIQELIRMDLNCKYWKKLMRIQNW